MIVILTTFILILITFLGYILHNDSLRTAQIIELQVKIQEQQIRHDIDMKNMSENIAKLLNKQNEKISEEHLILNTVSDDNTLLILGAITIFALGLVFMYYGFGPPPGDTGDAKDFGSILKSFDKKLDLILETETESLNLIANHVDAHFLSLTTNYDSKFSLLISNQQSIISECTKIANSTNPEVLVTQSSDLMATASDLGLFT
jgi:hypothetical protein